MRLVGREGSIEGEFPSGLCREKTLDSYRIQQSQAKTKETQLTVSGYPSGNSSPLACANTASSCARAICAIAGVINASPSADENNHASVSGARERSIKRTAKGGVGRSLIVAVV